MPIVTALKNEALDLIASRVLWVSIHSADPGSTGANELAGGSPAYGRKAVAWSAAAAGSVETSAAVRFDIPAGANAHYLGAWSAASGGTFRGSGPLSARETFAGQGTYEVTRTTIRLTDA